jgi:hypothetical protein
MKPASSAFGKNRTQVRAKPDGLSSFMNEVRQLNYLAKHGVSNLTQAL